MKSWNDDASLMDNRAYYNKESSNIWYREGEFLAISFSSKVSLRNRNMLKNICRELKSIWIKKDCIFHAILKDRLLTGRHLEVNQEKSLL